MFLECHSRFSSRSLYSLSLYRWRTAKNMHKYWTRTICRTNQFIPFGLHRDLAVSWNYVEANLLQIEWLAGEKTVPVDCYRWWGEKLTGRRYGQWPQNHFYSKKNELQKLKIYWFTEINAFFFVSPSKNVTLKNHPFFFSDLLLLLR